MNATPDEIAHYTKIALERGGSVQGGSNDTPSPDYDAAWQECLKRVNEDEFQAAVMDLARRHGWRRAHFRKAKTSKGWRTAVSGDGKGWPDLVLLRRGVMIVAELKVPPNKTSEEQKEWLAAFRELAEVCDFVMVFEWRPSDWMQIEAVIAGDKIL